MPKALLYLTSWLLLQPHLLKCPPPQFTFPSSVPCLLQTSQALSCLRALAPDSLSAWNTVSLEDYKVYPSAPGCLFSCVHTKLLQSCPNLCHPMDCNPPRSSVQGILQARILEWVAVPSSWGSCQPRNQTVSLASPALAGVFFTTSATWEAHFSVKLCGLSIEKKTKYLNVYVFIFS